MDSTVNKPKRLLTARIQSARAVFWVLDEKGGYLERAVPRLAAELGGTAGDTVHGFLGLLRHRLVAARRVLVRAERRLLKKEAEGRRLRRRRDRAVEKLREQLVALRGVGSHVYGEERLDELGFAQRTPESPEPLLELATQVAARLTDPRLELPPRRLSRLVLDWGEQVRGETAPAAEELRRALEALAAWKNELDGAFVDRDAALEAFDRSFLGIARTVESLLRMTGLDDLADRVRPSTRRSGQTEVPFAEPAAEPEGRKEDLERSEDPAGSEALTNHKGDDHGRKSEQTETSFDRERPGASAGAGSHRRRAAQDLGAEAPEPRIAGLGRPLNLVVLRSRLALPRSSQTRVTPRLCRQSADLQ